MGGGSAITFSGCRATPSRSGRGRSTPRCIDSSSVRLVRHGNKEIEVLKVFQTNKERFAQYSSWQEDGKFGDSKHIAIFSPARGTTSLFLGIWSVDGMLKNSELKQSHFNLLKKHKLPKAAGSLHRGKRGGTFYMSNGRKIYAKKVSSAS